MPALVLGTSSRRLRAWAVDDALPFWATAGFDAANGRFEERLAFGGDRLSSVPIRLMVQARQIYVYATAARKGWYPGSAGLAERAFNSMVRDFHGSDGKDGWVFSIDRRGAVVDARRNSTPTPSCSWPWHPSYRRRADRRRFPSRIKPWPSSTTTCARSGRLCRGAAVDRRPPPARTRTCTCSKAFWPYGAFRLKSDISKEPVTSLTSSSRASSSRLPERCANTWTTS